MIRPRLQAERLDYQYFVADDTQSSGPELFIIEFFPPSFEMLIKTPSTLSFLQMTATHIFTTTLFLPSRSEN